ncbi:MAG TPA: ABC transporter permease subunit [Candidatus Methylacidiphilales bacterium]|nr:ABC transporter permease subunit [Candidatus Methylacidiphilales bacterium]
MDARSSEAALDSSAPYYSRHWLVDASLFLALAGVLYAIIAVAQEWSSPLQATAKIDLSPWSLPQYTMYSLMRWWIAYGFSLAFTIAYASWAFYDRSAQRFLLPLLDIMQSIPVLGFLPGLVLALVHLFPTNNVGLELACVLMIFTGQVWNMTFAYYDSLRAIPDDHRALARLYGFTWWQRFWKMELPFGAQNLLYNSMVSMAGGWFFLTINEAFMLGDKDFRLPGIGSYMSVAIEQNNISAQIYAIIAMAVMIISVDRLVWWPLVVWSRKFKLDDFSSGPSEKSALALWLARSSLSHWGESITSRIFTWIVPPVRPPTEEQSITVPTKGVAQSTGHVLLMLAVAVAAIAGAWQLFGLLNRVEWEDWKEIAHTSTLSLGRVLAAVALGSLWAVPVGVWIGLNPAVSGRMQPIIQFAASFPAPMIYPWLLGMVLAAGGTLESGSILLLLFGTQWYILFNVAASAGAVPNEIISAASIMQLKGTRYWTRFILPAVFPGLVTGWITAAGGAWNATIVAEYIRAGGHVYTATGLGAVISLATEKGDFPKLAAAVTVMAAIVVVFNRTVWRRLQAYANDRCRFGM